MLSIKRETAGLRTNSPPGRTSIHSFIFKKSINVRATAQRAIWNTYFLHAILTILKFPLLYFINIYQYFIFYQYLFLILIS